MQDFVVFDHVCKTYQMGDVRIEALKDASFTIDEGEICVIVGQSGGPTAVINASLYGVITEGKRYPDLVGCVYGMHNGI